MIIIENFGFRSKSGDIFREYVTNIYNDGKLLAHLSNEYASLAFQVVDENLNEGDIFKIRILDNNKNLLEETDNIFEKVEKGRIYYKPVEE